MIGNKLYSSYNALSGYQQSRRDDLISLVYVLVDICNGDPHWLDLQDNFHRMELCMLNRKMNMTPERLCIGKAACLTPFCEAVFCLDFEETPDYGKLAFLLTRPLLELG
jgi:casein kinase 1